MGIRSLLAKPAANFIAQQTRKWSTRPIETQELVFKSIVRQAKETKFALDHDFTGIQNYDDFKSRVPVRDYEGLKSYIDLILAGGTDILWPGKPEYLAKTSGTTSGVKYIPITRESVPNHINSARNALFQYINETGNARVLDGKLIFLSGSPVLEEKGGIKTGRLSGIVNHHVPTWLRSNQMPTYSTNCLDDWEEKVDQIVEETINQDMSLISGIPPWVQMYFDRLNSRSGKRIKELFPNFSLFMYGGVNYEPYRAKLEESIGGKIDSIETYPASEGFIAYQDTQTEEGLLLLLKSGIFFEFIPTDEYFSEKPSRLSLVDVKEGINYALIISSNAGLWAYSLGDTVRFVSTNPYRLIVTGRIKHFISAFGEHVIAEEVEKALKTAMKKFKEVELSEFTVAPNVTPETGLPHHEWFIEFAKPPEDLLAFASEIDCNLQELNSYYDDLISGNVLTGLNIIELRKNAFIDYMRSQGKLGGQNKVPRLSNDRKIATGLMSFTKEGEG